MSASEFKRLMFVPSAVWTAQSRSTGPLSSPAAVDYANRPLTSSPAECTSTAPCRPSPSSATPTGSTSQWKTRDTRVAERHLYCPPRWSAGVLSGLTLCVLFPPCSSLRVAAVGATDRRSSAWSVQSRPVPLPLGREREAGVRAHHRRGEVPDGGTSHACCCGTLQGAALLKTMDRCRKYTL